MLLLTTPENQTENAKYSGGVRAASGPPPGGLRWRGSRYRKPVSQSRLRLFSGSGLMGIGIGGYVLLDIAAPVVVYTASVDTPCLQDNSREWRVGRKIPATAQDVRSLKACAACYAGAGG